MNRTRGIAAAIAPGLMAGIPAGASAHHGVRECAAMTDDPICAICEEPMEPIPPVGWVCLSEHAEDRDLRRIGGLYGQTE
jgi:hypothetical protein